MFGKKNKEPIEQGRPVTRQMQRGGAVNPAFSYYTNRSPAVSPRERLTDRPQLAEKEQGKVRRRGVLSTLPFWLLVGVVLVCVLKVLWLSTDPKIIVVGNTTVSATYVQPNNMYETAARSLLKTSIANHSKLTADLDGIARRLQRQFPELQHVVVNIPLVSNRPVVYVEVAQPSLIVQTVHGNYALNRTGIVLARAPKIPASVPVVVDQSGATPKLGGYYLPGSTITFIQTVEYQLMAAHSAISAFVLPSTSPYELDVRPEGQPYVLRFNLEEDAKVQSGAAIATLQSLGANLPKQYLDVRVPGRVYYK